MFTGIVQAKCQVATLDQQPGLVTITLSLPPELRDEVNIGASIAVDGVCLTVTAFDAATGRVSFDMMQQTLDLTSHGVTRQGDWVNVERSARANAEIGGHCVSGHVDGVATITSKHASENNLKVTYHYDAAIDKYLFERGFVSLNGCSLTIAHLDRASHELTVSYIPETLKITTHGDKQVGDVVNIEVDRQTQAIVDTVERVLAERDAQGMR